MPPSSPPAPQAVPIEQALAMARDHERAGRLTDAQAILTKILAVRPDHAAAARHLGELHRQLGQGEEAVRWLRHALALQPDALEIVVTLGTTLNQLGHMDDAIALLRRALALRPDIPELHNNLACALRDRGELRDAQTVYRRALELRPAYPLAHSNLISALDLTDGITLAEAQAERRRWHQALRQTGATRFTQWTNAREPERRLRIGYVSPDLRRHAAAYAVAPMLTHYDRLGFEVTCYSGVAHEDDMTASLKAAVEHWRPTLGLSDDRVAAMIREDAIDLLVDLSGHSPGNRLTLFAAKPAPVQITAWGHPTGTGISEIDALFADPILVPPADRAVFAETIVDLPCALAYALPADAPDPEPLPALDAGRVTFGCFNRFAKVSDPTLALWSRVLAAVPTSCLLLKDKLFSHEDERVRTLARLRKMAIAPERVAFRGATDHRRHLEAYGAVDIALDPFPQNGGITTFEALSMGVPVVTRLGATPLGRLGGSILAAMALDGFIAADDARYVEIARRGATDLATLATLRTALRGRLQASPAGNAARYVGAVEAAYRNLWRRWCAGSSPDPAATA